MPLTTKYLFNMDDKVVNADINRLTNQLWKLIPMRENNENWRSQLDTVILEIVGLNEIFSLSLSFLILISKLEGLRNSDTDFLIYRKTVFESISLLRELNSKCQI